MKTLVLILAGVLLTPAGFAVSSVSIPGAACSDPPTLHCPDDGCPTDRVINQGPVVEMKTRRTYFLDYPCDLQPGEKVTFILSLHGGGSYGNWQRHYFPLLDHVNEHRLVVATPHSPTRVWTEADDEYLRNIVEFVVGAIGAENIRAFWLAGHSQGGMTSNRILRDGFFKARVDGWISLSGGRLGGNPGRAEGFGPPSSAQPDAEAARARARQMSEAFARAARLLATPPENDISFIYTTGAREVDDEGVPASSAYAQRLGCSAGSKTATIEDSKAGYVYDPSRQDPPNPAWGLLPGPGTAEIYTFPDCRGDRIVADVVRLEKGHTEGLEPKVTEALARLMVSAPGGRIQALGERAAVGDVTAFGTPAG